MTTALVIGNMIGSGIFFLPAALAKYGSISVFGWVVAAIGGIAIALVFIRLSKQYPGISGGPYVYSQKGFGDLIGFLMGWGYWISIPMSLAGFSAAFVGYTSVFFPFLKGSFTNSILFGISITALLGWVNIRGIRDAGIIQVITTILKLTPLVLITVIGVFFIDPQNFAPFRATDDSLTAILAATGMLTFFTFLGVECATIPAENVKDPEKTIKRATLLGTVGTALIYISSTIVLLGLLSASDLASSEAPFADAAIKLLGPNAGYFVSAGVAISVFGALNGWILIGSQVLYSISHDKLLPPMFSSKNRAGVPHYSVITTCIVAMALMFMSFSSGLVEAFEFLVTMSVACTLLPYIFSAATAFRNTLANRSISTQSKVWRLLAPTIGIVFAIWVLTSLSWIELIWALGLFILGLPFFIYQKVKDSK